MSRSVRSSYQATMGVMGILCHLGHITLWDIYYDGTHEISHHGAYHIIGEITTLDKSYHGTYSIIKPIISYDISHHETYHIIGHIVS